MKGYKKSVFNQEEFGSYTSSTGKTVKIKGINPFLVDVLKSSIEYPEKPTYEIKTDLVQETHILTQDIADQERSEGNIEIADKYEKAIKEYNEKLMIADSEFNSKFIRVVIDCGVIADPDRDEEWKEAQEFFGLQPSTNKKQRKYDYVIATIIGSPEDLQNIIALVMERTGVPKENLAEARGMFRDNTEEGQEQDTAEQPGS